MKRSLFWLFLRAKEKNSTLPEMFFQTQKLAKTYMLNQVSPYSKTKLSDTDSTRTKDLFNLCWFLKGKDSLSSDSAQAVFWRNFHFRRKKEKIKKERERKPKNPTEFSRRKKSLTIQVWYSRNIDDTKKDDYVGIPKFVSLIKLATQTNKNLALLTSFYCTSDIYKSTRR